MPHLNIFGFISSLFILYAETHYSFKGIYNRLKKREPEIIADSPHRIEPGNPVPVLILIKDANLYPIQLRSIQITLYCQNARELRQFEFEDLPITATFWYKVLQIFPPDKFTQECTLDVTIQISIKGKCRTIKNDNYTSTSHAPLKVFLAERKLPKSRNWYFGDFHFHSNYTSDQVEFGAPLEATSTLARAMGFGFLCITDHSYDLDDEPDNYLKNDPNLTKWKMLQHEIQAINQLNTKFIIVPGEEVSAGNARNENIHILILNHAEFLPGDGDSAEKWLQTKPDLSIEQILDNINSDAVAFAAHPGSKPPFIQRLLVGRGSWSLNDCRHLHLHGLQIWNGTEEGLEKGKEIWIKLLLQGRRIFISGGNDAHGNFNRFRQIGIPFLTMRENHQHLFGKIRTGVLLDKKLSLHALVQAFKNGRMIVTNGPFVNIRAANGQGHTALSGDTVSGNNFIITAECLSTPEFGNFKELRLFKGNMIVKHESLVYSVRDFSAPFKHNDILEIKSMNEPAYIRAELYSELHGRELKCFTNPIWLNGTSKQECQNT